MVSLSSHLPQFNVCPISTFPGVVEIETNEEDTLGRQYHEPIVIIYHYHNKVMMINDSIVVLYRGS